jgi:hypothetical protein
VEQFDVERKSGGPALHKSTGDRLSFEKFETALRVPDPANHRPRERTEGHPPDTTAKVLRTDEGSSWCMPRPDNCAGTSLEVGHHNRQRLYGGRQIGIEETSEAGRAAKEPSPHSSTLAGLEAAQQR